MTGGDKIAFHPMFVERLATEVSKHREKLQLAIAEFAQRLSEIKATSLTALHDQSSAAVHISEEVDRAMHLREACLQQYRELEGREEPRFSELRAGLSEAIEAIQSIECGLKVFAAEHGIVLVG